jgi:thiamine-monophosphate kinase
VPLPEKALISRLRSLQENLGQTAAGKARVGRTLLSGFSPGGKMQSHQPIRVIVGIGDDSAVLRSHPGCDTLVTTDFSLEGSHFRRDWHSPESVGHRCLARGLSDIAAMGGDPAAAFLSLALPQDLPQTWVAGFLRGLTSLANRFGVTLAGGDTAQSSNGILADIMVIGSVPRGKAILRCGARPGDAIYISGELGGSAAAPSQLMKNPRRKVSPRDYHRHFFPEPRVELGRILRQKAFASAMIDTSDGLSTDLAHLCEESGVGAMIEAKSIPPAKVGRPPRTVDLDFALHGGEDYELLFTVPHGKRLPLQLAGVPLAPIGKIVRKREILLVRNGASSELRPQGWEHFRSKR